MISQDKLITYASNFLIWEIREIEKILETNDISDAAKELLEGRLKELKRDAEEIEKE